MSPNGEGATRLPKQLYCGGRMSPSVPKVSQPSSSRLLPTFLGILRVLASSSSLAW